MALHFWCYFMFFILVVFLLLWGFQIIFLEKFYDRMKTSDIQKVAAHMLNIYGTENYEETYDELAYDNDLCIVVVDKYYRTVYSKDLMGNACLVHSFANYTSAFISQIRSSKTGTICGDIMNEHIRTNTLVYGTVIGAMDNPKGYLLLNTPLVPVGSTEAIIKRQLLIISAILLMLGLLLSIYLSRRLARPIASLTKSAKQMAKGNYNVQFDGGSYLELQQLAGALTYAAQEISRVDTLQRDLIANVSHDLRTPLTMMKAYAEMIRDLSGDNPVKRAEHLNIIIEETDRLALMVNDILDLSKLESGGLALTPSTFGIRAKLSEIIDRYRGLSAKTGYHIHFTPDEETMVTCDAGKIEQVICNLINNAVNYTGPDKQIFVRQINTPNGVRIEVQDTGAGIDKENLRMIFDKYYRSENHKREVVGTGLGLSIVKAIMKLHNYSYGVDSTLGKGSTFWFVIHQDKKEETHHAGTGSH